MNHLHLTPAEWKYVTSSLINQESNIPRRGNYTPVWRVALWTINGAYDYIRDEALHYSSKVRNLLEEKENSGSWPRGQRDAKYWLRARWDEAIAYAKEGAVSSEDEDPKQPKELQKTISTLLIDLFDERLVDFWLMEHISDITYIDTYKAYPEDFTAYENWLRKIQEGEYLPK